MFRLIFLQGSLRRRKRRASAKAVSCCEKDVTFTVYYLKLPKDMEWVPAGIHDIVAKVQEGCSEDSQQRQDPDEEDGNWIEEVIEECRSGGEIAHLRDGRVMLDFI